MNDGETPDMRQARLARLWQRTPGPEYGVVDRLGRNRHQARVRRLSETVWLHHDDVGGYSELPHHVVNISLELVRTMDSFLVAEGYTGDDESDDDP